MAEIATMQSTDDSRRGHGPAGSGTRIHWLIIAVIAFACSANWAAATESRDIFVNGVKRSYRLYLPAGRQPGPLPAVIALHGAAQSAREFEIDLGMNRIADRERFAVIYPVGLNRVWNDSRPAALRLEYMFWPGDDVPFLTALVHRLVAEGIADPAHIYLAGLSMGGFMTARMACERAGLFAAIAVISATVPEKYRTSCRPNRPMPVLFMHGTLDPISSWHGMILPGAELMSAVEATKFFAGLLGCMVSNETTRPKIDPKESGAETVTVVRWSICRDNAAVALYLIRGGGHLPPSTDPGRGETMVAALLSERSHALDAAEEIWSFFRQFRNGNAAQRGISAQ